MLESVSMRVAFDSSVAGECVAPVRAALKAMAHDAQLAPEVAVGTLAGGASNANFIVRSGARTLVLRLAEQDVARFGVDRVAGCAAHSAAAQTGVAPALVAAILPAGHCLSDYVQGRPLAPDDASDPDRLADIAGLLRRLHAVDPIDARWSPFEDIRRYSEIARVESLPLPDFFDELERRVGEVEQAFVRAGVAEVLCHDDLVPQNFMLDQDGGLTLVDWEYAGMGNPFFDLANAAVNFEMSDTQLREFLRAYFEREPEPAECAAVELMRTISGVREGTWAVIAAPVLDHGLDYAAWGAQNFEHARETLRSPSFERQLRAIEELR